MQPGEVIGPGGQPPEEPKQPISEESVQVSNEPAPDTSSAATMSEQNQQSEEPASQWQFRNEESPESQSAAPERHDPVEWTASEYIAHEKGLSWYVLLGLAIVAFAAIVYGVTGELISSVVIVVMGIAFGAFAARQPQELNYSLDNDALHVGGRSYGYSQFKSFTIVDEGPIHSIMLMPLQRFMPPLSVYYAPEDEDKIANALSSYLPYEDRKQDVVDRIMRKVRF
jgi:hypothetical protein